MSARRDSINLESVIENNLDKILIIGFAIAAFYTIINQELPSGLTEDGLKSLGIFVVCVIFWVSNVIPLMITSLLAVILFPLMGIIESSVIFSFFGNRAVFFILGAFVLASSIIRSGLSTRIAMVILLRFGVNSRRLIASMLLLPAFMSFWMSEHAVAALMFPIVNEISKALRLVPGKSNYAKALFLASAWGCVTGGIATLLGGARAALAIGILNENTGRTISFETWMAASLPTVILLLGVAYLLLDKLFLSEEIDISFAIRTLRRRTVSMGRVKPKEVCIGILMVLTIIAWILYGHTVGLANIALTAVVVGFVFNLMEWNEVEEDVNWGVFLMYGGAISLGYAMERTGAAQWLASNSIGYLIFSKESLLVVLSLASIVLTEAISNSAVIAFMMPICLTLSKEFAVSPEVTTLAMAVPSGLAYVLPMGTPAVALAYSSGYLKVKDVVIPGLVLTVIAWIVFCILAIFYWPLIGLGS